MFVAIHTQNCLSQLQFIFCQLSHTNTEYHDGVDHSVDMLHAVATFNVPHALTAFWDNQI